MTCTTINCFGKILAKGLCTKCYYRIKRGGTAEVSKRHQSAMRKCEKENCENPHHSNGLCGKHYTQLLRRSNPELRAREAEKLKLWRKENPEKHASQQARSHENNKDKQNAYVAQWKKDNKKTYNAYLASRKKRVKLATPSWADLGAIRELYFKCPVGYHVDHIIPLNGINVSGLHTIENLQYLRAEDNLKKSNKL